MHWTNIYTTSQKLIMLWNGSTNVSVDSKGRSSTFNNWNEPMQWATDVTIVTYIDGEPSSMDPVYLNEQTLPLIRDMSN